MNNIREAVKERIFPHHKFITDLDVLKYSEEPESICQLIVTNNIAIKKEEHKEYWSIYSKYVKTILALKRNNTVNQLRRRFCGKSVKQLLTQQCAFSHLT